MVMLTYDIIEVKFAKVSGQPKNCPTFLKHGIKHRNSEDFKPVF